MSKYFCGTVKNKAVFLDRDGIINIDCKYVDSIEKVQLINEALISLREFQRLKYQLIIITNQAVVARGLCSEDDVKQINEYIKNEIYDRTGVVISSFYFCPHHPNATLKRYKVVCNCRKPAPGMLIKAAKEHKINLKKSYMIGDRMSDIIAGKLAGCKTIYYDDGSFKEPIMGNYIIKKKTEADLVSDSWKEITNYILKEK